MKKRVLWLILSAGILGGFYLFIAGCDGGSGSGGYNEPYPCNYDFVCDPGEEHLSCPDCDIRCDINEGEEYDYIISEIRFPEENSDFIGVDLTGDGKTNNRLGTVLSMVWEDICEAAPNSLAAQTIQNGNVIMLGRLVMSDWTEDELMAVQILRGTSDATEQLFDVGNNQAMISEEVDRELHLCGHFVSGFMVAGKRSPVDPSLTVDPRYNALPSILEITIPFCDIVMDLTLEGVRVEALTATHGVNESSWTEVMMGGGLSKETMDSIFAPAVADRLNESAMKDPKGNVGDFVINTLDGNCTSDVEGCEHVVSGEGECAVWDPAGEPDGPVVTETEIKCSNRLSYFFKPDIDSNGDGEMDLVSLGFMVSAVGITIIEKND